jgi:hypothetical protein
MSRQLFVRLDAYSESMIIHLCSEWDLDGEYVVSMVDRLMASVWSSVNVRTAHSRSVMCAGCVHLLFRLTAAPPSIVEVADIFPSVTTRHIMHVVERIKVTREYQTFRGSSFVLPPKTPRSRIDVLASRLGLDQWERLEITLIRESIGQTGGLSSRPSTIDGVALARFRKIWKPELRICDIENIVGRNWHTITKTYDLVFPMV